MRLSVGMLACAGLAAASLALADPAAPAASSATPATAAQPAKAEKSGPTDKATAEAREKHFKAEGYTVKTHNGDKLYCISNAPIGSHIPQERCYTEDILMRMEDKTPGSTGGNSSQMPNPFVRVPGH